MKFSGLKICTGSSSLVYLIIALANIVLSIPLCMEWGVLGAAIGTAIATGAGMLIMNRYYRHRVGLDIPRFWLRIRHLVPAMIVPGIAAILIAVFLRPAGYGQIALILCACLWLCTVPACGCSVWTGLSGICSAAR